jgi:predicted NodU family carbamoyl transferase
MGQLSLQDLDYIVFYDKPLVKFERLLETYLGFAPKGLCKRCLFGLGVIKSAWIAIT